MSGKNFPLLMLIMLLLVHLLHTKSLKVEKEFSIIRNYRSNDQLDATESTGKVFDNSSCSPYKSQLDFYNELYGNNIANSFNGNTLYYALKAEELHKNMTSSEAIADRDAENNAIIDSYNDSSKFIPAGMDKANKVVCAKILDEMEKVASSISKTALCGWDYICDYKRERYPNYLFKARCISAKCNDNCNQESNDHNMCQSHGIHVTVLEMRGSCEAWVWGQELLPIACTCFNSLMRM